MGNHSAEVRILASSSTWVEGTAVDQLRKTAELPGMKLAVGLPDLHPGKGSPIGAAFVTEDRIYPTLVGNDIGCGIALWRTDLNGKKPKRDQWAERLKNLDEPWDGDTRAWLLERDVAPTAHDASLGTIGSGNHFAELQSIESIENASECEALGITADAAYLCVHSGSRGLGEAVLREHVDQHRASGLPAAEAVDYLAKHDHAMRWASANRQLIAKRMLDCLRADATPLTNICHNWVEQSTPILETTAPTVRQASSCAELQLHRAAATTWIHRKGAAPSTQGPVVIPGSRGSFSYLVKPVNPTKSSAFSLAHGAGRKWSRSDSRGRLEKRYTAKQLERTELGSHVICEDKDLLYEEAPQAYKNITTVIDDLVNAGLAEVLAILRPLITYKVRR